MLTHVLDSARTHIARYRYACPEPVEGLALASRYAALLEVTEALVSSSGVENVQWAHNNHKI